MVAVAVVHKVQELVTVLMMVQVAVAMKVDLLEQEHQVKVMLAVLAIVQVAQLLAVAVVQALLVLMVLLLQVLTSRTSKLEL